MAHLIFLTGTPATVAKGSGTWVGISVLRQAILALGHDVTLLHASHATTVSRILFNLAAGARVRGMEADAVIGFDLDGVFLKPGGFLHVAAIKGVLADEARYEHGRRRLMLAAQARLEARHVRRADRVLTTSCYSSERITDFYGAAREKIAVVPELIDLVSWDRALRAAPVIEGPSRILCVAHLYTRKRIDTLLRALARVERHAELRIVGVGPERDRLGRLAQELAISDRIHFLGHLPLQELATEYRNAAIFILPTAQEGFGIVFLEAMASSLPIVAGRAAAVPEVVVDGVTGLLVNPGDESAVAAHITTLLDDPTARAAIGRAGREHVRRYDAPVVARQFLEAIGISA